MRLLLLLAVTAFLVATFFSIDAHGMRVGTAHDEDGGAPATQKDRLVSKLRAMRPHTLVTYAQESIDRMESTAYGKELRERVRGSDMSCADCENYVGLIMAIANNEQLLNDTKNLMKDECAKKFANDTAKVSECDLAVDVVTFAVPALLKALTSLAWDVPFNLCAILFDNVCKQNCCTSNYAPEQVYISLDDSNDFSRMRVTWVTLRQAPDASVVFTAPNGIAQTVAAEASRTYTFAGWVGVVNTAVMTFLTPNTTYAYTVGSNAYNRSQTFNFTTFPSNIGTPERPLRIINIADMAYDVNSDFTVQRVAAKVLSGQVDMVIHNGDIGYADGYMLHWDMFMRKVSPFTAHVPYMTTPGNHELYANFTAYKTRLARSMPKDANTLEGAMYYALNIGPTRILLMDSETYIDTADLPEPEVAWAQHQLSSQDRKAQPWSLVFHHRPLYCDQKKSFDCKEFAYLLRLQAEGTYLQNKVDFVSTAHVHYYLRSYPLAMGAATGTSYDNPSSPVYVVNGAAGNREGNKNTGTLPDDLYAYGSSAIGYGVMEVSSDFANNKHSMTYSFFESSTDSLLDTFTINKNL